MRTEPSFSANDDHLLDGNSDGVPESQSLSDYRQHYGLSADPFVDDPHFPFYPGAQRRQVIEQLLHLCQFSHNLLLVAGEYGVGKTRMAQALIDGLDDIDDICFVEGQVTSDINSVLTEIYTQFELGTSDEFFEFCKRKSEQDGLVVLIVDNAHHLSDDVISELVNLLQENFETRLHLVLFAEPHLSARLENSNAQDVVLTDFLIEKFSLAEAVDYLNFRMEMADYLGPEIFTDNKVEPWWRQSQGQLFLLHEYAQEHLLTAVSSPRSSKVLKSGQLVPHMVATSVLISALFVGYLYFGGDLGEKTKESTQSTKPVAVPVAAQSDLKVSASSAPLEQSIQAASEHVPVTLAPGGDGAVANKAVTVTSSIAASGSSIAAVENTQVVKQSVVPLVQTNELQNRSAQKQNKASSSEVSKQIKSAKAVVDETKASTKVKSEGNNQSLLKAMNAFSAQEQTILSWGASEYTLQIVGLSNEKSALAFIAAQSNKKDLLLFRSVRQGKDWFVVVLGHYADSAKARVAIQLLPESQQKASPWPRDLKTIQREINQRGQ